MINHSITNNQTKFDLEPRTLNFAKNIIKLCKILPFDNINSVLINQIIRSSASVGANYREANDALSKKDFIHRLRISRKEAKETIYWLQLINEANQKIDINYLVDECSQLRNILSSIITKMENKT